MDQDLPNAIGSVLDRLDSRKAFFQEYAASGGSSEIFTGWFLADGNSGDVLKHGLLARLADFRLDLSLDVYPTDQR